MGFSPCCFHESMANCPHGLKPILHLLLVFAAVVFAARAVPGATGTVSALIAKDRGTIVGPDGSPFNLPTDVAVGGGGRVYVLDGVNHRVVAYDAEGQFRFQFGTQGSAPAQFVHPLGIATDPNGNVYVADSGNRRLQVFTAEGQPLNVVPLPATTSGSPPEPTDVAVDPIRKRLYIADNDNHIVHIYDLTDRRFESVWGSPGQDQRQFRFPFLIDVSAQGYLLVVEPINTRVQVLNPDGKFVGFIGGWGLDPGQLFRPKGVALWRDRVFVTDSYLGSIQIFDLSGRFFGTLADATGMSLNFTTPTGIAVDPTLNRLYVVELKAHRVRCLDLEIGVGKSQTPAGPLGSVRLSGPLSKPGLQSQSDSGTTALPNPSRECAICHVRWVQAFGRSQTPDGPMHDVLDRQAGSGDMCLSCHDGSVADSRFKVWSTRHHTTDAVPSPAVHIPTDVFPLDAQGRMTCATCHTAHAVAGDSDLRTVIFLRRPNVDSSLCLSCHPEHAQKSERHHPLGHRDSPIPQVILDAGGKTAADGHTILCQTCHEPHGARNAWMLVLPPSELCVACHEDKAPETALPAGAPVHRIGQTYAGFQPPKTLLEGKATFGPNGELGCLSCHRLHDASGVWPLLIRKNEDSALCLACHEKEKTVLESPHDLRRSSPETVNAQSQTASTSGPCGACHRIHGWAREVPETNRPHSSGCMECHKTPGPASGQRPYVDAHAVGVPMPPGTAVPLPLDRATNDIGCLTCHDPHVPRSSEGVGGQGSGIRRPSSDTQPQPPATPPAANSIAFPSSAADFQFLRRPGSEMCVLCHGELAATLHNAHDPARFTPSQSETLGIPSSAGSCRVCHTVHSAQGPHLWARTPAGKGGPISSLCWTCHNGDSVKEPRETHHPLGVPNFGLRIADFGLKQASDTNRQSEIRNLQSTEVSCTSCHEPHGSASSHDVAEDICLGCHEDKRGIKGSIHDPGASQWAKDLGFVSKNLCLDCHPIHGPKNEGGLREVLAGAKTSDDLCEACHASAGPGSAVHTPHLGKANGDGTRIRCTNCHDIHQHKPDSKLLRATRQDSAVCLTCHSERRPLVGTLHDLATSAPQAHNTRDEPAAQSGSCGGCHLVHPPSAHGGTWAQRLPPEDNQAKGLCTGCHRQGGSAEDRIPEYREHPETPLLNRLAPEHPDYMPTFDDQGRPSPTGVISCPTCHQAHPTPATGAAQGQSSPSQHMFLRTGHQTLCADCHGVQALWRFLFFHNANRNPERKQVPMYAP